MQNKVKSIQLAKMFIKQYKLRIKGNEMLEKSYSERISLCLKDPNNPILRVTLEEYDTFYLFYDIGTHNQIYT